VDSTSDFESCFINFLSHTDSLCDKELIKQLSKSEVEYYRHISTKPTDRKPGGLRCYFLYPKCTKTHQRASVKINFPGHPLEGDCDGEREGCEGGGGGSHGPDQVWEETDAYGKKIDLSTGDWLMMIQCSPSHV